MNQILSTLFIFLFFIFFTEDVYAQKFKYRLGKKITFILSWNKNSIK